MLYFLPILVFAFLPVELYLFEEQPQLIETQATITSVESKVSGKRPRTVVQVQYVIASGDTINSQLQLTGIPFLESSKEVGDTLTILYQKDNPYLIKTKRQSFFREVWAVSTYCIGIDFCGL